MKTVFQGLFGELHDIILLDSLNYYEMDTLIIHFLVEIKQAQRA